MKVYVTKYALTKGILEVDADVEDDDGIAIVRGPHGSESYYRAGDWHRTLVEAVRKAKLMLIRKRGSVRAQLNRLESMTFEIKEERG